MKMRLALLPLFIPFLSFTQSVHHHSLSRQIQFPDLDNYLTISCDLHIHTSFSDGSVWPNIRVKEAIRDSLDVIAITDHIEYLPHHDDIPFPDRNKSYEIAKNVAKNTGLIVVNGSEITRAMPPGHSNAVFLTDVNALVVEDSIQAFREAKRQGAFIFWNHPNWLGQNSDGIARLSDLHRYLISEGLLHGIEVVNDVTYSAEALQIAIDNNLTIMGTSDIHELVDWQYKIPDGGHRPITLTFAREKSAESVKEALFEGRTVVFFDNLLIGKTDWLNPLIQKSIVIDSAEYIRNKSLARVYFKNLSCADFLLKNESDYRFHRHSDLIRIKPYETVTVEVKVLERKPEIDLTFEILNAIFAPHSHPLINWRVRLDTTDRE